ncbi:hypothetical protein AVEN_109261-1 [Araneus ventricosus]|uniref:Uncharacterized protein n=1 Tax=Araneus ventricosus TaxID=182803 RepID=A0A4Y2PMZ4_ARAVE|nr:hypothetical protein AVEN_109261-1 [Araneus ventricosus]
MKSEPCLNPRLHDLHFWSKQLQNLPSPPRPPPVAFDLERNGRYGLQKGVLFRFHTAWQCLEWTCSFECRCSCLDLNAHSVSFPPVCHPLFILSSSLVLSNFFF